MKKLIVVLVIVGIAQWFYTDRTHTVASSAGDIEFDYIVKYAGEGSRGDSLPMLIALHGNGDTASNFYETALNEIAVDARIVLIKGPFKKGSGNAWPWSPEDFQRYGDAFDEAVRQLTFEYDTKGKPVLLGYSGGGMMAYFQAATHGERYSAVFPISGKLSKAHLGNHVTQSGGQVYAYHGKSDSLVSLSGGKEAVKLLRGKGIYTDFTEFQGGHHGLFTNMKSEITDSVESKLLGM